MITLTITLALCSLCLSVVVALASEARQTRPRNERPTFHDLINSNPTFLR